MAEETKAAGTTEEKTTTTEAPKEPPKVETAAAKEPEKPAKEAPPAPEEVEVDEDRVEAALKDGKGSLPAMPVKAFMTRVRRAAKSELEKIFGTSDKDAIIQWKRDFDTYLKDKEERERAAMSEKERLESDLKKASEERDQIRSEYDSFKEQQKFRELDSGVSTVASKHIDDDAVDYVSRKFADHLLSLDEKDPEDKKLLKSYQRDPDAVSEWFSKYAKKHPKFAREGQATEKKKAKAEPLTTSETTEKPKPDKNPEGNKKSAKDMSYQELRQKYGVNYRG